MYRDERPWGDDAITPIHMLSKPASHIWSLARGADNELVRHTYSLLMKNYLPVIYAAIHEGYAGYKVANGVCVRIPRPLNLISAYTRIYLACRQHCLSRKVGNMVIRVSTRKMRME